MDFDDTPEEAEFRSQARSWLSANAQLRVTSDQHGISQEEHVERCKQWQGTLFDQGWAGFMLNERQNRASVRRLAELNANWIGVGHGDPITSGGATRLKELALSLPKD